MPLTDPFGDTVPYALMATAPVWTWKVQAQLSKAVNDSDPFGYVVAARRPHRSSRSGC